MSKTIAWVVNRLERVGGGERLILEGARYYRSIGHRVLIITWFFDESALFDGKYENRDIITLSTKDAPRENIIARAWSRAKTLGRLRRLLHANNVDVVFVQGEYDVALVYLATLMSKIRYRFLVFGQTFQYPHDRAKYSLVFRRHLREIVNSRPGYAETTPLSPPEMSMVNWVANELICVVRRAAVRKAERLFAVSRQTQWETVLLHGRTPAVANAGYHEALLFQQDFSSDVLDRLGLSPKKYVLSLCRLDRKKRIDLIISGFKQANLSGMKLVIGGEGDDEDFLRKCIADNGLDDRVLLLGRVPEVDMLPLKRHAAVFVSMDIGDYDISPLEAQAVGTPALCPTDLDEVEVLVQQNSLFIVPPEAIAVSDGLQRIIAMNPKFDRRILLPWTWETYFASLLEDSDRADHGHA